EIDLNIQRVQLRLIEVATALIDESRVAEAQRSVREARTTLTPQQTQARNLDLEMQSNAEKARATEEQLYSGRVRNTKEMQDMQLEIVSLKKRYEHLEERLLEVMFSVEAGEAALTSAQSTLQSTQETRQHERDALMAEETALNAHLAKLREDRKSMLVDIQQDSLDLYTKLKPRKNNQPVALMIGISCALCGVEQTGIIEKEVRRGQTLTTCLSCGRILLYNNR
ncbi:MAG: hypothetical protein H7175_17550, partial [Burkholderiales bacterium]|nr:hypothetical protein [Anaerolineae bacterium]